MKILRWLGACIMVACLVVSCNTGQRLSLTERKHHNNIRLPYRTEQKKDTARITVPQYITYQDASGKTNTIMSAELDSTTGEYHLTGGMLDEVTVTAVSKSVAERGGKVNIDFVVTVPANMMQRDWRMVMRPIIASGDDRIMLDSLEITGIENYHFNMRRHRQLQREQNSLSKSEQVLNKRKEWYNTRMGVRNAKNESLKGGTQIAQKEEITKAVQLGGKGLRLDTVVHKGEDYVYFYSHQIDSRGLATTLKVWFDSYIVNCGDEIYPLTASDTVKFTISSFLQFMDRAPRYVRKTVYRRVTDKMTANIQFPVGKDIVVDTLADNHDELAKVSRKLKEIYDGNEFIVDSVYIAAYSSPEGSYRTNAELSAKRSGSIKQYLSEIDKLNVLPPAECIKTLNVAEDWTKLRRLVLGSPYLRNAEQVVALMDAEKNDDERELRIRSAYPADYQHMREHMYPKLRSVEFTFHLARRNMVEDIMYTDEIDTEYAQAVELMQKRKYKEAMPKLLEYRDLNTALCYMSLGYNKTAIQILDEQAETADREYLKAILYAREGEMAKAVQLYLKSCEMDDSKIMRGELDPEIADLIKAYGLHPEEHVGF